MVSKKLTYRFFVNHKRGRRGHPFGQPEAVPDTCCAQEAAQDEACRNQEYQVAEQGDYQRRHAQAQPLQHAAGDNGHRGYQKAQGNDAQSFGSHLHCRGIFRKEAEQLVREQDADDRTEGHDHRRQAKRRPVNLPHPLLLARAVVIAD